MVLGEKVRDNLKKIFEKLKDPVLIVFRGKNDKTSEEIKDILKEVSSLSDKIQFEESNELDCIDYPCFSVTIPGKDLGIRFMGKPTGGEFQVLIDTIIMISTNDYKISERVEEIVEEIDRDVDIKVFVTSSCGFCPPAIKMAYSFAMVNNFIKATVIDCYSFQELAIKYNVAAVPKTVINDRVEFIGAKEDNEFLGYIIEAVEAE